MNPWQPVAVSVSLAALLSLPGPAPAQTVEITPMGGYRVGGSFSVTGTTTDAARGVEVKDSGAFGVHLGFRVSDEGEIEALYARQNTRLAGEGFFTSQPLFDLNLETYQFAGNYLFREEGSRWRPFIGVGLGVTRLVPEDSDLESETRFSASFAAGVKAYVGAHFGFRFEVRGLFTVLESDSDVFCASLSGCLVRTSGAEMSQAEFSGGLILRF
jgi:outer membrane protein W